MNDRIHRLQMEVCKRYGTEWFPSPPHLKVGIAENVRTGVQPINGLRHQPVGDTSGWYLWAGEVFSEDPDFFKPLHVSHLEDWCPGIIRYLGLPPGWRFLKAGDYEDVWYDESLLTT